MRPLLAECGVPAKSRHPVAKPAPRLMAALVLGAALWGAAPAHADTDVFQPAVRRPPRVGALGRPDEPAGCIPPPRVARPPARWALATRAPEAWSRCWPTRRTPTEPGMRSQFLCHWYLAEFAEPGKTSWNLEPWRPRRRRFADAVRRLQSRWHRGAVLTGWTRQRVAALVDHTLLKPGRPPPTSLLWSTMRFALGFTRCACRPR